MSSASRDRPPPELGVEPLETCAAFHGGEVNETNRARGLLSDMPPYIGLIHGRNRMPLHNRMAVKAINAFAGRREEITKRLVSSNRRGGDDERLPVRRSGDPAEDGRADVYRAANRPHPWRGVER
jgi:hypothetical protein